MLKKEKVLAIDDCRELSYANVLCRTFEYGIMALNLMGPWDTLILDHDLGGTATGYDIVKWLNNNLDKYPTHIEIITGNPVGLDNIGYALEASGIMQKVNGNKRLWRKTK